MFTRHGPVIFTEAAKQRAFAVRSGWLEPGMAPYFGSIDYMQAKNFEQFKRAMLNWGAPTENQVYADTNGNIGWVPGGLTPIRPNWDGLLPVPGDGRYEWAGFLTGDKLPSSLNPKQGWFATANEMNLPAGYPYAKYKLGFEWPNDARHARIGEVLDGKAKVSIEDSMRLQNDMLSIPARRMMALLAPLTSTEPKAHAALELLRGWDAVESAQSPQAALFEVWWSRHLNKALRASGARAEGRRGRHPADVTAMMNALERPAARFGRRAKAKRDELLLDHPGRRLCRDGKCRRTDPKAWQWGKLHHSYYAHPMSSLGDGSLRAQAQRRADPGAGRRIHGQPVELPADRLPQAERPVVPRGGRCRQLGQLARDEHARPVGRSGQPALPRPGGDMGQGRVFPAAVFAQADRGCNRKHDPVAAIALGGA